MGPHRRPRPPLGNGVSRCRTRAPASLSAVPVCPRGTAAIHHPVAVFQLTATAQRDIRRLPDRLRRLPLHHRVLPRTGRLPRPAGLEHEHGPVAVPADDRFRRRPVAVHAATAGRQLRLAAPGFGGRSSSAASSSTGSSRACRGSAWASWPPSDAAEAACEAVDRTSANGHRLCDAAPCCACRVLLPTPSI